MKNKHVKLIMVCTLLLFGAFPLLAYSKSEKPNADSKIYYSLDGKRYSKDEIIEDFLKVAFSKEKWPDLDIRPFKVRMGDASPQQKKWLISTKEMFDKEQPWISEYITRNKGVPSANVLNRFSKLITVGFGWPPYIKDSRIFIAESADKNKYSEIKKQVEKLRPSLESIVNQSIQVIDPKTETTSKYAVIRIVPADVFYPDNKFKAKTEMPHGGWTPRNYELFLHTSVRFTPNTRSQVEGYFIPEADNTIGMAVCEINPFLEGVLFNALVSECLVRALGLPEMEENNKSALLGHWNAINDNVSKVKKLDGKGVNDEAYNGIAELTTSVKSNREFYKKLEEFKKSKESVITQPLIEVNSLSQYDSLMLRLLYCKKLKAGMSLDEVEKQLKTSNECFEIKQGDAK